MAWEWVGPVATAAVGVFGMTATVAAASMNRKGQERQEVAVRKRESFNWVREERYKAYREVLVAVRQIQDACEPGKSADSDAVEIASRNLVDAVERVALVGSPATFQAAEKLVSECRLIALGAVKPVARLGRKTVVSPTPPAWDAIESQKNGLIVLMREDLPRVSTGGFEIALWP